MLQRISRTALLILGLVVPLTSGCTYTAAVSQTNIPAQRGKPVEARVKKYIFLGFNFSNDDVFQLTAKLQEQCPGGEVKGISTQDMRTMYVLFFFWARDTLAKGYCVPEKGLATGEEVVPDARLQAADSTARN